jgi:hypothetical protein
MCLCALVQAQAYAQVPVQVPAPAPAEVPQVSLIKQFDADDLNVTGFLASRDAAQFPDYRVYLGVDYGADLGSLARLTSRAFYGTGTYDGFDPKGPALPEEVRTSGVGPGQWVGADWKVESHAFSRHALSAGVEYRQELALGALDIGSLLGRDVTATTALPERKVGFITNDRVSLADDLSLNVRLRYDEAANATASAMTSTTANTSAAAIAPRAELIYKPGQASIFSGLLESANARVDASGFEVALERNGFAGTRTRVSYGRQATADWLAGGANGSLAQHLAKASLEVPILPKRLSTSFELQYVGLTGPLAGDSDRQRLIGQHVIGNLTVASGTVSRDTRVTFGMRNLFGAKPAGSSAPLTSFVPPEGRSLRLDVERKL